MDQPRKDSLLTRGVAHEWTRMAAKRGEEGSREVRRGYEGDTEDRLRSAAIPLVRSRADRRAAMEFMRLGVGWMLMYTASYNVAIARSTA